MNKTEAQQILDNCTTHKRYRCPLTNELHDVIQIIEIVIDKSKAKLLSMSQLNLKLMS